MKPLEVSNDAELDLDAIVEHYLGQAGVEVALSFLRSWDRWLRHVREFPNSGSLRLAAELRIDGIRVWPVADFPYLAIYLVRPEQVLVLRVLHVTRDIPKRFRE